MSEVTRICPGCGQQLESRLLMMDRKCWHALPAELRAEWFRAQGSGNWEFERAAAFRCIRAAIVNRRKNNQKDEDANAINPTR